MESPLPSKRLLVMTSATGGGHDAHARATAAWCRRLFGSTVEVTIDHTLENSHEVHRAGLNTYHWIQRRAPWIQHLYYNFIEFQECFNRGGVPFGREYYVELLETLRPDAILSVHDCLNLGYLEVAKEVLGERVRFATYCLELGAGYGFSRNWVNRKVDLFLARTPEAAEAVRRRGVPAEKIRVAGHWSGPEFYEPPFAAAERAAGLIELGLAPDRLTVLLSTGGAGAQNHLAFLAALRPLAGRVQVIVLCRRSEDERSVSDWSRANSGLTLLPLAFSDRMARLMRLVSVVVARPGAATCGEAILSNCPILLNVLGGIMPQELPNWRHFRDRGTAQLLRRPADLAKILSGWLERPAEWEALKKRLAAQADRRTPEEGLRELLALPR